MNQRMMKSPVGRLMLSSQDGKFCGICLAQADDQILPGADDPVLDQAERELEQYFAGERRTFDLPLRMDGSAFDREVWRMLLEIPFGETRTYGQLASTLGKPGAARAVGGACSRNPLLIVVPCHRVIAGTGKLTGFAAGLEMKRALLALEGREIKHDRVKEE